jgi:CRP-like cAMP-binding protein
VWSVFFPTSGTLSVIVEQPEGRLETATTGREGVADAHAALGSRVASQIVLSQVAGESIDIDVDVFAEVYAERGHLSTVIHGYLEALFAQSMISAACIALHPVNERCARWLLETHDRVDGDEFTLRQEFLATMLGVRRPTVSIAAGTLAQAGLIRYHRGDIDILDREGLEDAACSCYESIRLAYSRLVPLA